MNIISHPRRLIIIITTPIIISTTTILVHPRLLAPALIRDLLIGTIRMGLRLQFRTDVREPLLLLRDRQGKPLVGTITRRMKVGGRLVPMATPTVTAPVVHQCRRVRDTSTPIRRTSIHRLITSGTTANSIIAHTTIIIPITMITIVLPGLDCLLSAHVRATRRTWVGFKTWR